MLFRTKTEEHEVKVNDNETHFTNVSDNVRGWHWQFPESLCDDQDNNHKAVSKTTSQKDSQLDCLEARHCLDTQHHWWLTALPVADTFESFLSVSSMVMAVALHFLLTGKSKNE